jgi:hypothetical protein
MRGPNHVRITGCSERLKSLADGTMRFACINYLEAIVAKVPDAMRYLSEATGPAAPFEEPAREIYAPQLRRRPLVRLGSTFVESARDMFAKWAGSREEKTASGVSPAAGAHSDSELSMATNSNLASGSPAASQPASLCADAQP